MTLAYSVGVNSGRLDAIETVIGVSAKLRIYTGSAPAVGWTKHWSSMQSRLVATRPRYATWLPAVSVKVLTVTTCDTAITALSKFMSAPEAAQVP